MTHQKEVLSHYKSNSDKRIIILFMDIEHPQQRRQYITYNLAALHSFLQEICEEECENRPKIAAEQKQRRQQWQQYITINLPTPHSFQKEISKEEWENCPKIAAEQNTKKIKKGYFSKKRIQKEQGTQQMSRLLFLSSQAKTLILEEYQKRKMNSEDKKKQDQEAKLKPFQINKNGYMLTEEDLQKISQHQEKIWQLWFNSQKMYQIQPEYIDVKEGFKLSLINSLLAAMSTNIGASLAAKIKCSLEMIWARKDISQETARQIYKSLNKIWEGEGCPSVLKILEQYQEQWSKEIKEESPKKTKKTKMIKKQ